MLYEYIVENRTAEFRSWPYHRYIDAFVAPVAALVPALGVAGTRNLLKAINYAACAAIGIASALLLYGDASGVSPPSPGSWLAVSSA